jgi:predicted nucleic acid-binding Zn ribbon protein
MVTLASSSSSPRHRGSIERGVDGGDHCVIGGLATEMCSDRLQEMIALSNRQRRRRALQQRELLVREREGTWCGHVVFPQLAYMRARRASSAS